jgi:hypothetical protein
MHNTAMELHSFKKISGETANSADKQDMDKRGSTCTPQQLFSQDFIHIQAEAKREILAQQSYT